MLESAISTGNLRELFIEHLGWDHAAGHHTLDVGGQPLILSRIAHKRGVQVLEHRTERPLVQTERYIRAIQSRLVALAHEHILWVADEKVNVQVWAWALRDRETGRLLPRLHPAMVGYISPEFVQQIEELAFTLDEEESITVMDVVDRMAAAFGGPAAHPVIFRRPTYAREGERLALEVRTGGERVMNAFLQFHRPLAVWFARRYRRIARSPEEMEQAAMIGLMRAARCFDPSHGAAFSTYAYRAMQTECWRELPRLNPLGWVPHYAFKQALDLRWATVRLRRTGDGRRWASLLMDAGREQGLDFAGLETLRRFTVRRPRRLRTPREASEAAGAWDYTDAAESKYRHPLGEMLLRERDERLHAAIASLEPREQFIVRRRFGLDGPEQTLMEIGDELGVTRERIRQIETRLLEELRNLLSREGQPSEATLTARAEKSERRRAPPRGLYCDGFAPDGTPIFKRIIPRGWRHRGGTRPAPQTINRKPSQVTPTPAPTMASPDPDFWTPEQPMQMRLW